MEELITELFERFPKYKKMYGNSKTKFIEKATIDLLRNHEQAEKYPDEFLKVLNQMENRLRELENKTKTKKEKKIRKLDNF